MALNQEYLEFLSDFVNGLNIHDQLPVPVSSYNIDDDELVGDFVHWLLQYLSQKHCPLGLVAPLVRSVVEDMVDFCRRDPEAHSLRDTSGQFSQLRLMQACTARANALCVRLHQDPALLTSPFLCPPPPRLVPVAAHGARSSQRRGMEDRHVVVHDFNTVFNVQDDTPASYYAVFDGHAGQDAAVFSAAHVHQFLAESTFYPADPVNALKEAILRTDNYYLKKVKFESRYQSGTTALCALLRGRMLHVAWVGDSQAVLVRNGRAEMLVDPHKPKRPDEERRIVELGGLVLFHGMWRVNGQLAVSRAIGDPNFKPYVSADAEVRSVALQGDEELLILASDGLFDFVTPQQAAAAAFQQMRDNPENINAVCSRLINLAKNQGSTDDISVIVAFLTEPREIAKRPVPPVMDMDDLVDTSATHVNGSSNNQWSNPFHMHEESAAAAGKKHDALNIDLDPLQPTKQNGGGGFPRHQDLFDMGPETDVDRIDESDDDETGSQDGARLGGNPFTMTGEVDAEEAAEAELRRFQQQQPEFDAARHPREETPTPPADQVPAVENLSSTLAADVDNVADSGDESEEEWKYFSVEPSKQASQPFDQLLPSHQPEEQPPVVDHTNEAIDNPESEQCLVEPARELPQQLFLPETEDGEDSNMDSQLNPNAAEFVPVSPTRETCMLPSSEDHPQAVASSIDNLGFDMDAVAPTENVPVYGGFEHQPMDFLPQDEMMGDKENLILQPNIAEFAPPSPAEHILEAASNFSHDLQQTSPNILDFCGTPPIAICEPCAPFTTETVEQVEDSHFEGGQTFEQEMQQTENLEMFNSDLSHPEPSVTLPEMNVDPIPEMNMDPAPEMNMDPVPEMNMDSVPEMNMDPVPEMNVDPTPEFNIDPSPEMNLEEEPVCQFGVTEAAQEFAPSPEPVAAVPEEPTATFDQSPIPEEEKDLLVEQTDVLVETPNFSVAQTPAFPVVENLVTPGEESAATASPAVEEAPVTRDVQEEDERVTRDVQEEDERVTRDVQEEDERVTRDVQEEDERVTRDVQEEDERLTRDVQVEDEPVTRDVQEEDEPVTRDAQEEDMFSQQQDAVTPMSPQLAVCPAFPSEVEPQAPVSPLEDIPSAPPTETILQPEVSPLPSPVRENAFYSEDLTAAAVTFQEPEPVAKVEDLSPDAVTATPPPTPAAPLDELTTENEEKLPSREDVQAFSEVIEKLAAQPEEQQPSPTEEQPISPEEPAQEHHIKDVLAVAAVTATAVGAAAAITAVAKSPKPSSPTKTEASKKPASPTKVASPTKDKPSSPIKKTTAAPASKAAPKPSAAKAPAPAKTTSTTATKPAPARSAPAKPATTAAPKAAPAAKKPATSAPAAKPRTPTSTTTAAPRTTKPLTSSGATSPTKPTAPKPKPPVMAASKAPEAKKPLANGDAAKPAPRRPISATSSTTTRAAPRPAASSAAKPAGTTVAAKPTATSAATKSPAKPRPASAAVNGVAKPKADMATKTTTARPASATTTARRVAPATKPASAAKQDKETTNKQLSSTTRTTTTTKSTTVTKSTTLKSAPAAKVPPIKKPSASAATKTKSPSKATDPPKSDEPVQVNGNAHEVIPNGNSDDIPQQELLIEPSAPCLIDGVAAD